MRYTTTDAPLNGIQDDSLGDKMGIADKLIQSIEYKEKNKDL
jgi:hypothetical protein